MSLSPSPSLSLVAEHDMMIGYTISLGMAFAFIRYEKASAAREAVRTRNGYELDRLHRLRVEVSRGGRQGEYGGYKDELKRTDHRATVTGIPESMNASWQDLKDFSRPFAVPGYTAVLPDGTGVLEFTSSEDLEAAIHNLHDTVFRNRFGEGRVGVAKDVSSFRVHRKKGERSSPSPSRGRERERERER